VKFFIENRVYINKKNKYGNTPLINSIKNDNKVIMKFLIENRLNVNKEKNMV